MKLYEALSNFRADKGSNYIVSTNGYDMDLTDYMAAMNSHDETDVIIDHDTGECTLLDDNGYTNGSYFELIKNNN